MATTDGEYSTLFPLTDCIYFANGNCMFKKKCHYRHCELAMKQLEECSNWPDSCRNKDCPYRHTKKPTKNKRPPLQEKGFVSFFWDIENVPIPKQQKPFDIVQRIRKKLVIDPGLQEAAFSCFCNSNTISQANQQSLHNATVRIIHVPDRKPGAIDRQIMLELDRFERVIRPPATVVLISGDIDFVGKLNDLRHQAGFQVIVIHNKLAKEELKATVNAHYSWEFFTQPLQQEELNLENLSKNLPIVSNDQLNNNTEVDRIPTPKLRPSRLRTKSTLHDGNNPHQNDIFHLKPPLMYQCFRSASQNPHPKNHSRSRKPQVYEPVNQVPMFYGGITTPPTILNSVVAPRARNRQVSCSDRLYRQNLTIFGSYEQIPAAVHDDTSKKEHNPMACPLCTNEFDTIQALRQHQKDKKHLFYCSLCNDGFPASHSLKQHQIAKGHDASENISDQVKPQSNTNNDSKVHGLIAQFEQKFRTSNDK
ncbi:unnamed protein product [Rotaria sp. Silwood2]|nr:unnamed protein product [Rotaria sp. Silwood2]